MAPSENGSDKAAAAAGWPAIESVLLIDGDNDPNFPPDFPLNERVLVRVFVRPEAKMPRGLERRLTGIPQCVAVSVPKGGANAADFGMSLHAGILHASVPLSIPFTLVTNDKALSVMAQELGRLGRRAEIWTSHPDRQTPAARRAPSRRGSSASSGASSGGGRGMRRGRGGSGRRPRAAQPRTTPAAPAEAKAAAAPPAVPGAILSGIAASYAGRLRKRRDPPSRLKSLLNDISNRTATSGFTPEEILGELKRSHGVQVDDAGHVKLAPAG